MTLDNLKQQVREQHAHDRSLALKTYHADLAAIERVEALIVRGERDSWWPAFENLHLRLPELPG